VGSIKDMKLGINHEAYPMLGEAVKTLEKNPSIGVTLPAIPIMLVMKSITWDFL
jgi:hypothetical protein